MIRDETVAVVYLDQEFIYWRFGDVDSVDRIAHDGTLARFFHDPGTLRFFNTSKVVRQVTRDQAVNAAVDYISAVSEAAGVLSSFHLGIGGPVDVLFVGQNIVPERIKWKELPPN